MKLISFNTQSCHNFVTHKTDYIFVSKDFEVLAADIPAIVASDHRPHTATVRACETDG